MPCNDAPPRVQQVVYNLSYPEFPGKVSSLNLLENISLFGQYLTSLCNSNAPPEVHVINFIVAVVSEAAS